MKNSMVNKYKLELGEAHMHKSDIVVAQLHCLCSMHFLYLNQDPGQSNGSELKLPWIISLCQSGKQGSCECK
jgi:hypothetical protein